MNTLTLRPAASADAPLLLDWRNETVVRENSLSSDLVGWSSHQRWLDRKLNSPECRIWLMEQDGTPVGQIRYERDGPRAIISLSIASEFRGRGLAPALIELSSVRACRELRVERLVGVVKEQNRASRAAFARAGFEAAESLLVDGQTCVRFEKRCPAVKDT